MTVWGPKVIDLVMLWEFEQHFLTKLCSKCGWEKFTVQFKVQQYTAISRHTVMTNLKNVWIVSVDL